MEAVEKEKVRAVLPLKTATYHHIRNSKKRFSIHEGGTRSGKTYSILEALAEICWRNKGRGLFIDITRVNGPAIDAGPLRDWREILMREGWLSPRHQRHDRLREFNMWGNMVSFFSVDQSYKMLGRKRHILYMNEANQYPFDSFMQLNMRTEWRVIMDYNPYETESFIYDKILTRPNAELFHSTYKDNPHLSPNLVKEIEAMEAQDNWYWLVYGLGQRAANPAQIFRSFRVIDSIPETIDDGIRSRPIKPMCMGLDWGFSADPTAIVMLYEGAAREVKQSSGIVLSKPEVYIEEVLYQTQLTNPEIAEKIKQALQARNLPPDFMVVCDSADPKSIEEIRRAGINAWPCTKGADSVRMGIQLVQQYPLFVSSGSVNWIKESKSYKWQQDKNGKFLNAPVDLLNHLMDATRYGMDFYYNKRYTGQYAIG
jgi:phage terminase large subunit